MSAITGPARPANPWMMALGILFMVGWLGVSFVLGAMSLMASLMANDSGSASGGAHLAFIGGVMGGQVLTGLAGAAGGLAFFWNQQRRKLLLTFIAMLLTGIALVAGSFWLYFP